ncbi:MAG: hypothetical protein CVV27_03600 [Candidatus Melainabacteria bacterium HGW-Melainabacteria-1]|nr:MAG: hypothetical protein CVV27_03600 [Candidatus Melainabacteria bacterium HGW-Melainabacteria-1]
MLIPALLSLALFGCGLPEIVTAPAPSPLPSPSASASPPATSVYRVVVPQSLPPDTLKVTQPSEELVKQKFDECAESFQENLVQKKYTDPRVTWVSPYQELKSDNPGKIWTYQTPLRTNVGYEGRKEKYEVTLTSHVMAILGSKGFTLYCHNQIGYNRLTNAETPSVDARGR